MTLSIYINGRFTRDRKKILVNSIGLGKIPSTDGIKEAYFFTVYGVTITGYVRDLGDDYKFYIGSVLPEKSFVEFLIEEIKYGKNELLQEVLKAGYTISNFINHIENISKTDKEIIILSTS